MRKSASGVVETAGFTSPLVMPPGTYTPLETDVSADGVTTADEDEAIKKRHQEGSIKCLEKGWLYPSGKLGKRRPTELL